MLTARGWWFLVVVFAMLALGILLRQNTLTLIGLTLVLWFAWEALSFATRVRLATGRFTITREMRNERGPVETLWAGQTFEIRVGLRLEGGGSVPHAAIADFVPFALVYTSGEPEAAGPLGAERPLELRYHVRSPAVGRVRFEGLRLQLTDLQGFFYHATFVSGVVQYRVLPAMVNASGQLATTKRHNLLPPPGIHRLHRPGSGSELLDLRDYLPGDPPKTIAWKVSARRDRLITKEFESEVPVRCTLFVDTSNSVRVGPPGQNALARLIDIAAAVAQANAGVRDLTGLCLFDEERASCTRPGRTGRHLAALLNLLTDAAGMAATTGQAGEATLLPSAYAFAQEVYPHLMRQDVNRVPFWLPWLGPVPAYTRQRRTLLGTYLRLLYLVPFWLPFLQVALISFLLLTTLPFVTLIGLLGYFYHRFVHFVTGVLAQVFSSRRRRLVRWRKRMAALLSQRYALGPGGLSALLEDEERLGFYLQRFLGDHSVPYALPLYDARGRYLFAAPGKVSVLAKALLQSVGKGHDNEQFVLLADLLELAEHLEPLLRAVRVAQARHHQVLVICPWPPGLPPPDVSPPDAALTVASLRAREGKTRDPQGIRALLQEATTQRFHRAFRELRQTFGRLGVPVLCAQSGDPVRLILDRLDRLRSPRRRR